MSKKKKKVTAVVLAAGKGKRAKTTMPKVLLDIAGCSVIFHILYNLKSLKQVDNIVVVLGHKNELVRETISKEFPDIKFVIQKKLNGTAKAVEAAYQHIKSSDYTLVLCGDAPLIRKETLRKVVNSSVRKKVSCGVLTAKVYQKTDLGRMIRDDKCQLVRIAEKVEKLGAVDCEEVNSGVYCFNSSELLKNLPKIKPNKKKKEYFLTDMINLLYNDKKPALGVVFDDIAEIAGINTQKDLSFARKVINSRLIENLMEKGVNIIDPDNTYVAYDTKIGKNSTVYPFTFIEKNVIIGSNCELGPFIRVRKGSCIKSSSKLGNFIEINRSTLAEGVKMKHFGYLGDTLVQTGVNIGAGCVVANYDGKNKHKTVIEKDCFIGSDTIIVAPRRIKKGAATGAGSVVTKDVNQNTIVAGVPARVLRKRK